MSPPRRSLFIASLGNPPPKYHRTLHSAGHILLRALASHLDSGPFAPCAALHSNLVAEAETLSGMHLTLWQSPTLMNASGPTLVKAYKAWLAREFSSFPPSSRHQLQAGRLIVVHDELQAPPGKLQLRRGGNEVSNRGHNGLKSVLASLGKAGMLSGPGNGGGKRMGSSASGQKRTPLSPGTILVRIGIGIGRPTGRDPEAVSEYVLQEMSPAQYEKTCAQAGPLAALLEREIMLDR